MYVKRERERKGGRCVWYECNCYTIQSSEDEDSKNNETEQKNDSLAGF